MNSTDSESVDILLVEDNLADIRFIQEAIQESRVDFHLSSVTTGEKALAFLRREGEYAGAPRPKLILLDLNLPGMKGHSLLSSLKASESFRDIPVIVLTSSESERDVRLSYTLQASGYLIKRSDMDECVQLVEGLERYWLELCLLPAQAQ